MPSSDVIVSTVASKILTREQAQSRKDQAVRFAENVLDDPDKADDIESEPLDDWIERKKITLVDNTGKRSLRKMANGETKQDLMDQIADLQDENDFLQSQLDAISDVLAEPADGGDDDDAADDDDVVDNLGDDY
jgi:hypothetical protein